MTLGNLVKPVFIASILVFSIAGLGFILQDASAEHGEDPGITKSVSAGINTLNFRDITNTASQSSAVTIDFSQSIKGFLTINLEDPDANLDSDAIDMLKVEANSTTSGPAKATVTLTESDKNTGIFSGTLFLSTTQTVGDTLQVGERDTITVIESESQGVARLQAELNLDSPGDVKITDDIIDLDAFQVNVDWRPVMHPVKIELLGNEKIGASIMYVDTDSSTSFTVGESIYNDVDMSGTRNIGDIRIANTGSDGTTILGGDADDDGASLTFFANPVKFVILRGQTSFVAGNAIYEDVDRGGSANPGDIRIANTASANGADGTTIELGDDDDRAGRTARLAGFVTPTVITISYANAVFQDNDNPGDLNMYYKRGPLIIDGVEIAPASGWAIIKESDDPDSHDEDAMTITSDPENAVFGADGNNIFYRQGVFAVSFIEVTLGIEQGIGGGGGGGLVRPGFVVNALAGANVISSFFGKGGASGEFTGGGSTGPAKPVVTSGTVDIISDESIGFVQQGVTTDSTESEGLGGIISESDSSSNSLSSTQNVVIGKDLTFRYNVYENKGTSNVIHATMYFFDVQTMDENDRIDVSKSETYIMYDKGKPVKVVDPYGYFEKATLKTLEIDTFNLALNYEVTFGKIMPESHIVLRTWDGQKYSTDTLYPNAFGN